MEKFFIIYPLCHSESKEDSDIYLQEVTDLKRYADSSYEYEEYSKLFKTLEKSAEEFNYMLEKCGRFLHRNEILGRDTI